MKRYIIEVEGYNDGHPYEVSRHDTLQEADKALIDCRKDSPKVRFRLIHEIKEFGR